MDSPGRAALLTWMASFDSPVKIEVRDLVKSYGGRQAVGGVSFEVRAGTVFGLLGPNGAGKTTLLECLVGLRAPDGGSLRIDGIDPWEQPGLVNRQVGAVLQSTDLQDQLTPREAIELFGAFHPDPVPTGVLLGRFRLVEKADAAFETLSTGQRQRLALALAFVHQPAVLCLDEPTAGLDAQSRRDLYRLIREWRDEGRTVLFTTHHTEEAHALCDQVAVLRDGRLVAYGPPGQLVTRSRMHPLVVLRTRQPLDPEALFALPEVLSVETVEDEMRLEVMEAGPAVVALVRLLEAQENEMIHLHVTPPSLEETVIELTGGEGALVP